MSVFKRPDCQYYSYDFRVDGHRYHGSTGTADPADAQKVEDLLRQEVLASNSFFRSIVRRARRSLPSAMQARQGYVYIIRADYFVKIGHSVDPKRRLAELSGSAPTAPELLFWFRGGQDLERKLHREFEACHHRLEWFFYCGKLKKFIEAAEQFHGVNVPPATSSATQVPSTTDRRDLTD